MLSRSPRRRKRNGNIGDSLRLWLVQPMEIGAQKEV
jgi:hypothetical protein